MDGDIVKAIHIRLTMDDARRLYDVLGNDKIAAVAQEYGLEWENALSALVKLLVLHE